MIKCAKKLKAAGIGLERARIAMRVSSIQYAVTADSLRTMNEDDVRILEKEEMREQEPLLYSIFQAGKAVRAVICMYSHFCSLAAQNGQDIPPILDDMAQIVGVYIRVCEAKDLCQVNKVLKRHCACLTVGQDPAQCGAIATGQSLDAAYTAALVLEKASQVYMQSKYLGGAKPIGLAEAAAMHLGYRIQYSRMADAIHNRTASDFDRQIPAEEMALRRQIVQLGRELSEENLVQGTWGNISVRLDAGHMLCTPSGLNYFRIMPYDIVRVDLDTLAYEGNTKPTGEKTFHAALLFSHPDIYCIIHTHPANSSTFAATHKRIPPADAAYRALLCGDVEVAGYGFPASKKLSQNVVAAIRNNRACVMENHGMLVCGDSIADAHEKCHAAEDCARAEIERLADKYNGSDNC